MSSDRGLQVQRTTLAWTRTAVASAGLLGLLIRHALVDGGGVEILAAVVAAVATVTILVLGRRRGREIDRRLAGGTTAANASAGRAALLVGAVGVLVVAVTIRALTTSP